MISIDDNLNIYINRGDAKTLNITANGGEYEFEPGDKLTLRIYDKNGYTKTAVLEKTVTVTGSENVTEVDIPLDEQDTAFCPEINKKQAYWYDISLNEDAVIVGYEGNETERPGVKQFIILPAKMSTDE